MPPIKKKSAVKKASAEAARVGKKLKSISSTASLQEALNLVTMCSSTSTEAMNPGGSSSTNSGGSSSTDPGSSTNPGYSTDHRSSMDPSSSTDLRSSTDPRSSTDLRSSTDPRSSTDLRSSTDPRSSTDLRSSTDPRSSTDFWIETSNDHHQPLPLFILEEEGTIEVSCAEVEAPSYPSKVAESTFEDYLTDELLEPDIEIVYGLVQSEFQIPPELFDEPHQEDVESAHPGQGIRMVTLDHLFEGINKLNHTTACSGVLLHILKEKIMGSRSEITIECQGCQTNSKIMTTREDINELLLATSMSAGLHHTGLAKVLIPVGCPIMSPRTFDRLQHVVGMKILKLAVASCRYWAEQEKLYAAQSGMPTVGGFQTVAGEGDACYSKRSRGTNYSALSGGAVVLGHLTKKVLDFEVCQAHCQTCKRAENKRVEPPEHRCPLNFQGSASQMEPELITRIFDRSLRFNGLIMSKFIADGDSSVLPTLRRNKIYLDFQVHIRKILCKLHVLRNFIKHLRDVISRARLGSSSFKEQLLRSLHFLEGKLLAIIGTAHENEEAEYELKKQLDCAVRHHFGRHNLCPPDSKCHSPSNREIVTDLVFDAIMSVATTSLLCHSSSLIENCDTNQVESFNNKQAEVTDGKRTNLSLSWAWIYRFGLSVLAWNSSDQDAIAMLLEIAKDEEMSSFHSAFNEMRAKKRFAGENYERPDHASGIRAHLKEGSIDPVSFESDFCHPYATGQLSAERVAQQRGQGYSSTGNSDRAELPRLELFQERDRVLNFLLRAHNERMEVAYRTASRHDSEEYVNIRSRVIPSDKIHMICKYVDGNKDIRVASWPNKLYNILGAGGVRYSDKFIVEQAMRVKALAWLENHLETTIVRVGTILHPEYPFLEGSPAGFMGEEHNVEVFYLHDHNNKSVQTAVQSVKWLIAASDHTFEVSQGSEEYAKIQGDLASSARESCIVVVLTDVDQLSFEVRFDETFWNKRVPILADFFYYGLVEQADPMKSRSLSPRDYNATKSLCESEEWRTWP